MKKSLLKILFFLFAALCPMLAAASEYRVDIDVADNVVLDIDGTIVTGLVNGMNKIDMGDSRNLRIIAKEGFTFTEVTKIDDYFDEETDLLNRIDALPDGRRYIDVSSSFPEDEWFRVRTAPDGDTRTAECTVLIDNPAKAIVTLGPETLELTAGLNTVKFNPESGNTLEIVPVDRPLYRVTHNSNEITTPYRYTIQLADKDEVGIYCNYPNIDYSVKFNLTGNGAADFITEVDVDGKPEFNWRDENFTVKAGTELSFKGNTTEFEVMEFTVNGHSEMFTNPTKLFITENTTINVSVRKYTSFEMTVRVDDPAKVHIYRGYSYNGDELTLTAGDNTVEITRNTPIISLVPADGCFINTLRIADYDYTVEELQRSPVLVGSLTDNEVLEVTTGTIVRDKKATVFVHNLAASADYFTLRRADLSAVTVAEGYNHIDFYDRDNAFRFETGGPVDAAVYLNDAALSPEPGGFNFCPELADGDVVKVYFDFTPALHTVTVEVADGAADAVTITRDHTVATHAADFTALTHTAVKIAPATDKALDIKLDGETLTADADGAYTFTVDADKKLSIALRGSGITDIDADAAGRADVIYNLQGIRVNGTLDTLPAGIYLVNGNKVYKR